MVHFLGTGAVWEDPRSPGRFLCDYSEHRKDGDKRRQCILFAWSDDLIHWHKFDEDTIFSIDENHYERHGRWDSIFPMQKSDGGYWGTWTATAKGRSDLNGGIGIGMSTDGIRWQASPPPEVIPDADEAGAIFEVDGKIHAMLGHLGSQDKCGMYAYVADSATGPYRIAQKNPCLLNAWHTYYSRCFNTPEGLLVNHHSMNGERNAHGRSRTYLAPFKRLIIDNEGTQRWMWWTGNEALKGKVLPTDRKNDFQQGVIYEGQFEAPSAGTPHEMSLHIDQSDFRIRFACDGQLTVLGYDHEQQIDKELQTSNRGFDAPATFQFRLLLRRGMLEVYLNNAFLECCRLDCPDAQTVCFNHVNQYQILKAWSIDL
jgi:hypothetical protein